MRFGSPNFGLLVLASFFLSSCTIQPTAQMTEAAATNVVLITLDGMRWQELFYGLDYELATHEEYSSEQEKLLASFWDESAAQRAELLFPFLHNTVFAKGSYVGDRNLSSCAKVSNDWYFSYPGYSEILTGVVNPKINSNSKRPNPERSFMELLNVNPRFEGRSAAFASWDVFPYIFNVPRSGLHVNAFSAEPQPKNDFEKTLNTLYLDTPTPWPTVRNDSFTHHYAMSYLKREQPKVLFISYGETDDFAHDGHYDQYIFAAKRTDRFIEEVWQVLQSMDNYRDNTALFITVDHGRGTTPIDTWRHHASKTSISGYMSGLAQYREGIVGSEAVWMAAMGKGVSNQGLIQTGSNCLTSNRIAATLMELAGENYEQYNPAMGAPLKEFMQ